MLTLVATLLVLASPFIKVGEGLKFPEGPAYDGKGAIYVSNCDLDYITKYDANGKASVPFRKRADRFTFEKTNGMIFAKDGSLFVCDFSRKGIVRIAPNGDCELIADKFEYNGFRGPNDLAFDPKGHLYFTDPYDSDDKNRIGRVYRIDRDTRKVTIVADKLAYPNGIAFAADGKSVFVAESYTYSILRYTVNPDGTFGDKQTFAQLPQGQMPDGIDLDTAGTLWVAPFGSTELYGVSPKGEIATRIPLPGSGATNVEFGDGDMKTLYITETKTGALYKMRVEVPGLPHFHAPPNRGKIPRE